MARVLSHPATVPGSAPLSSWKAKRTAPRMLYRVPTASLRPSGFSGLRSSNCLDALTRYGGGFHSAVVTGVGMSPRQRKANRFVLRAMFERFTEKAIKVVMNAQEEAKRLGHNYVGTEQILLGLIGEGTGIAAKVLKSMGINQKEVWIEVEKFIGRGSGFVAVEIPFTPRAKHVLELSLEEARQLGHSYIGSEHLLLGLLREGEGGAARVLENLGADPSNIRIQVIRMVDWSTENVGISDDVFDGVIELENRVRQIVMERAEAVRKAEELRDLEIYLGNQTADILEKVKEMSLNIYGGDFHSAVVTGVGMSPRQRKANQFVPSSKFGRFGRLNEKAIKVLILAHEEARWLGHNFIDTEQILLGLISEGTGVGAKVLESMGINLKDARAEVEKLIGRGGEVVAVEPPFTPRARRVLDLLDEEARQLGVNYIEPEHLLLCLLREGEGVAVRVLENLGADPSDIRTQVVQLVDRSSENVRISDNDFERVLELEDRVRHIEIARVEASIKDKELSAEEAYLKSQIADIWEKGKEMNKGKKHIA